MKTSSERLALLVSGVTLGAWCIAAASLAGCGMFGAKPAETSAQAAAPAGPSGLEAALRPLAGNAVFGSARFSPRSGGVTMLVQLHGLPGAQYRVVVHANGNCSSPNGFSAGSPWALPGSAGPPAEALRPVTANTEGSANLTLRLPGFTLGGPNGLEGKSVVVHDGTRGSLEARPDVPNDRVACGVVGPLQTLF